MRINVASLFFLIVFNGICLISYTQCNPQPDAGTGTISFGGGNYISCHLSDITITHNLDGVLPSPGCTGCVPNYWWAYYTCEPQDADPSNDGCWSSWYWTGPDFYEANDGSSPVPLNGQNCWWVAPITADNSQGSQSSAQHDLDGDGCVHTGMAFEICLLNEIEFEVMEGCTDVTISISGGYPEFWGGEYTTSNLEDGILNDPGTSHGGEVVISNLVPGDSWGLMIDEDGNGCQGLIEGDFNPNVPILTFEFDDFCKEQTNGPYDMSLPDGIFSFDPDPGDGASIDIFSGIISDPVVGSEYKVKYEVGYAPGCELEYIVCVEVTTGPPAYPASMVACDDGSGTVCFDFNEIEIEVGDAHRVMWYEDINLDDAIRGDYCTDEMETIIYAQVVDGNGCLSEVVEIMLTINEGAPLNPVSGQLCGDDMQMADFDLDDIALDLTNDPQAEVFWYSDSNGSSSINSPYYTGTTVVYAVVEIGNCISQPIPVDLIVLEAPIGIDTTIISCAGGNGMSEFNLVVLGDIINGGTMDTVFWFLDSLLVNTLNSPYTTGTDTIYAIVDNEICVSERAYVILEISSTSVDVDASNGGPYCDGQDIQLFASTNQSGTLISYSWTGPNGYSSSVQNPMDATVSGDYSVIVNVDGCFSAPETTTVISDGGPSYLIANSSTEICSGETACVEIELTGTPPFSLSYVSNGTAVTETTNDNLLNLKLSPNADQTYEITEISDMNCNSLNGSQFEITVFDTMFLESLEIECNATSTAYIVYIDFNTSPSNDVINSGTTNGQFIGITGLNFQSDEIPVGQDYNIVLSDQNACNQLIIEGTHQCDCADGGMQSMSTNLIEVCGDMIAEAEVIPDPAGIIGDQNDVWEIILHDSPNNIPGTIFDRNQTGIFNYSTGLDYDVTYYMSLIFGNDAGGGLVDLNDPCLTVRAGQPVIFYELPAIQLMGNPAIDCANDMVQIEILVSGNGQLEIEWTTIDGNIISGEDTDSPIVDQAGTYQVLVTNLNNRCFDMEEIIVGIDTISPISDAGNGGIISCGSATFQLTGSGSSTTGNLLYEWTGPGNIMNQNSLNPTINIPGVYYLNVMNLDNSCFDIDSVEVTQDADIPIADAGPNQELNCNNDMMIMLGGTNSSVGTDIVYSWTGPNNFSSDEQHPIAILPGLYTLDILDSSNNCESASSVVLITLIPDPEAEIKIPDVLSCNNSFVTLDGTASYFESDWFIEWFDMNDNLIESRTLLIDVNQIGNYTLVISNPDNGCTDEANILVEGNVDLPVAEPGDDYVLDCNNLQLNLDGSNSSTGSNISYTWSTSDGNIVSGASTVDPLIDQSGVYVLEVYNSDSDCTVADSVFVNADLDVPIADAGIDMVLTCETPEVTLGGTLSTGPEFSYSWSLDGNDISNEINPVVMGEGTYNLEVFNNENGCSDQDEVVITGETDGPTGIEYEITPADCMTGEEASVLIRNIIEGTMPFSYSLDGQIRSNPMIENVSEGNHVLVITDANGCVFTEEIFIDALRNFNLDLGDNLEINAGESIQLELITDIFQNEIQSIIWSPDQSLSCSDCLNPIATPTETTTYEVMITNLDGCSESATIIVTVNVPELEPIGIYIPSIFSPLNSSGSNTVFTIYSDNQVLDVNTLNIYDRWGNLVFSNSDFATNDESQGWNGTYDNKRIENGVYVYYAEIELIDGTVEKRWGQITLIK